MLHHVFENTIGLTGCRLVRAQLTTHVVEHVAEVQRVERAEPEVDGELQPSLPRRRIDPVVLLKQQDAEAVEAGVLDAQPVLRLVHPEAARST